MPKIVAGKVIVSYVDEIVRKEGRKEGREEFMFEDWSKTKICEDNQQERRRREYGDETNMVESDCSCSKVEVRLR